MPRKPLTLAALVLSSLMLVPTAHATKCHNETVYRTRDIKDPHRVTGTVIGAVAGGLIGNQVGGGKGKDLATIGGAVAGGVAGHKIQRHRQERYKTVVRVCK
ncbi:MAG: glycine zipper 2TM domain-containing protein [Thermomonas sp.]